MKTRHETDYRLCLKRQSNPMAGSRRRGAAGFTMIEIAISLAIIGFALVAIIGILPMGLNVQKDNRQETIINQDANLFMEAFRNGAQGADDLTNYVMAITNYVTQYNLVGAPVGNTECGFTRTSSTINGSATPDQFHLINGYRIIGLLSTPKYTYRPGVGGYFSNHVVAYVRSLSGPASEKVPQDNAAMHDLALSYKMFCSVTPVGTNYYHPSWINTNGLSTNSLEYLERVALRDNLLSLQANMHDVRLTFRWPLLPTGETGPGRQVYRAIVSGQLLATNDHGYPARGYPSGMTNFLFFFQPRTYITAKP